MEIGKVILKCRDCGCLFMANTKRTKLCYSCSTNIKMNYRKNYYDNKKVDSNSN